MLGVSGLLGSSGDGAAAAVAAHEGGGGGGGGDVGGGAGSNSGGYGEEERGRGEETDRSSAGNRWPRQETLALLKIRSDMDVTFRDSSLKGPLWEEVSRKLAELGYHRSAKKCKEKFENVFKYHRRTKEGRASKADGKTYRFFDQLQALETHPSLASLPHSKPPPPTPPAATMPVAGLPTTTLPQITVPSTLPNSTANPTIPTVPSATPPQPMSFHPPHNNVSAAHHPAMPANLFSNSTSSSTSSDDELERRGKRKRKWKDFFQRLMKDVIERQEELQKRFLEAIEKREHDRMVREEAWKMQEMARMNREHELLVQERSIAAAKDAAVIAFLQKITEQQNPVPLPDSSTPPLPQPQTAQPQPPPPQPQLQLVKVLEPRKMDNGGGGGGRESLAPTSSSRWPKSEVQALIRLRTDLDIKYQENGPKGPLWEEISAGMRKIGYNRNAKRCKEKWENINKYFKKVKESNKKRPEDSKTCPYFHQLEALYKEKNKMEINSFNPNYAVLKPENPMVPIMVQPEQQWPLHPEMNRSESGMDDMESENNMEHNQDEEDDDDDEDGEEEHEGDDEDEDDGGGYEIVTNKTSSMATAE